MDDQVGGEKLRHDAGHESLNGAGDEGHSVRQGGSPFAWLANVGRLGMMPSLSSKLAMGDVARWLSPMTAKVEPIGSIIGKDLFPQNSYVTDLGRTKALFPSIDAGIGIGSAFAKTISQITGFRDKNYLLGAGLDLGAGLRLAEMRPPWLGLGASLQTLTSINTVGTLGTLKTIGALKNLEIGSALSVSLRMAEVIPLSSLMPKALWRQVDDFQRSSLFQVLKGVDFQTLQLLLDDAEELESNAKIVNEPEAAYDGLADKGAEEQLAIALKAKPGQVKLSQQALRILIAIILAIAWLYHEIAQWHEFRESVCDLNGRVLAAPSLRQARDAVNTFICNVPKSATTQMRLVSHDNVHLRESPRRQSTTIMKLPIYSVLEVVDSVNRKWIQVVYKHEGLEITGWVSRSMVRTIPGR